MAREYAIRRQAHVIQSRIDPAKQERRRGHTNTDAHARFTDPNVVSSKVRVEIKVFEDGVVRAQQAGTCLAKVIW